MATPDADVVVVGAGPAGASAALALAAHRVRRILVIDAARFPRQKPCGGAIARRGIEALAALGVPLVVPSRTIHAVELRGGGLSVTVAPRGARPIGVVVRREELDASLVRAARSRGVAVQEGVRVLDVGPYQHGARVVRTSAGVLRARAVIGADGATSTASRAVRRERGGPAPVLAAAVEAFTREGVDDPGWTRMRYDFSLDGCEEARIPGYAWDFPCRLPGGACGVNRGIYSARPEGLARTVPAQAAALLRARGGGVLGPARSWPERLYDERRPISSPALFLAGEAIGVNAVTGEGIAPAIESAAFAARWTAAFLGGGPWEPYTHAFRRTILGRRLSFGSRLARLLYGPRGRFFLELGLRDGRFQQLLLEDFAGDLDIPHWKRWLAARLALDVAARLPRAIVR